MTKRAPTDDQLDDLLFAWKVVRFVKSNAIVFCKDATTIGIGAWLGTIMLFNVWVLIWPNQKKILGIVQASPEEIAKGKVVALMASRTNTLLSIPMILGMTAQGHGLPF